MSDTFQEMQWPIDQQLGELKTLTEKTTIIHTQLSKVPAGESLKQSISRDEILAKGRLNTVLIPPGSIRFPASMTDPPVQFRQPVEVNLADFHIDQLQMI